MIARFVELLIVGGAVDLTLVPHHDPRVLRAARMVFLEARADALIQLAEDNGR